MRIAVIADPYIPVPPEKYGGIERIIAMLVEGYIAKGHKVTLFAHPDSRVNCELIPYGLPPHKGYFTRIHEVLQIWNKLTPRIRDYDIIHSFGRLAGLFPSFLAKIPKVQSYQRYITARNIQVAVWLAGKSILFSACSDSCRQASRLPGQWLTIYNGVSIEKYHFSETIPADAPLVFLGRIEKIKGAHTAIEVAKQAGKKLIIAGNHSALPRDAKYWEKEILPHIGKNRIEYIGTVNDNQKNKLLGNAAALLMPIEWDEPFGIVMAEALACGTPVLGFKRGALPEIIESGVNGFVCADKEEMVSAVSRIKEIKRSECRRIAEERFSDKVIVEQYLSLYFNLTKG